MNIRRGYQQVSGSSYVRISVSLQHFNVRGTVLVVFLSHALCVNEPLVSIVQGYERAEPARPKDVMLTKPLCHRPTATRPNEPGRNQKDTKDYHKPTRKIHGLVLRANAASKMGPLQQYNSQTLT
jgi:hypothetical protein